MVSTQRDLLLTLFQPSEACQECSKKIPTASMPLHKEFLCTAKHSVSIKKEQVCTLTQHYTTTVIANIMVAVQVKLKSWEKRLVDELCGNDVKQLLKKAEEWEAQYLKALPKPGN